MGLEMSDIFTHYILYSYNEKYRKTKLNHLANPKCLKYKASKVLKCELSKL